MTPREERHPIWQYPAANWEIEMDNNRDTTVKKYRYLFGPVPSRRFGRSLGVDISPYKTCSFDCLFCQLGRTTLKTIRREEYVPTQDVIEELKDWIATFDEADYISLAGSGEPTLHSRFGDIIEFARGATSIPVSLLTNASLLTDVDVRASAAKANVVKVSLSAGDQDLFEYVNQPHPDVMLKDILDGLQAFRNEFTGQLWLEVFVMWGVNSNIEEISRIAELAQTFRPDRIHLNTAVRPPAESFIKPVPKQRLEELAECFKPHGEVVAEFHSDCIPQEAANGGDILAMLQRRPCTATEVSAVLGLHVNEVSKYIGKLERTGQIHTKCSGSAIYYTGQGESGTDE
jgi:wyosine [tRNA(Phe)-imidazoG37] synthetase (radical SAM superfamily)